MCRQAERHTYHEEGHHVEILLDLGWTEHHRSDHLRLGSERCDSSSPSPNPSSLQTPTSKANIKRWQNMTRQMHHVFTECVFPSVSYFAAQLVLHGEVHKADTGSHQVLNEPYSVQSGLELGRHHSHEDLATQSLHTVLLLQTFSNTLWNIYSTQTC